MDLLLRSEIGQKVSKYLVFSNFILKKTIDFENLFKDRVVDEAKANEVIHLAEEVKRDVNSRYQKLQIFNSPVKFMPFCVAILNFLFA